MARRLSSISQDWSHDPSAMPTARKFTLFGIMAFGQFMALFDIQIVAGSLSDIQAGLSAGPDEISWVQTAYLMAELVMIPLSGYLARAMSTRWLFAFSSGMFTFSSLMCGLAWNIESMIAFRTIQGFTGGAMVPLAFAVGFTIFSGPQRALIPAILGTTAVLGPALGPTAGGLISNALSWHWLFFVNILPGIAITIAAILLIRVDRATPALFLRIDWLHFFAMAIFLGGLQFVLEEGPRNDWFNDTTIMIAAWLSLVGFGVFLERALFSPNPVVSLKPLLAPNFSFACLFSLVIGFGLFASIYLVPIYLGRVRGFSSLEIGMTVYVVGIAQLFSTFIAASLSQKVDMRWMITTGLILFAWSNWMTAQVTSEWGYWEFFWPQAVRGFSLMLCIVPSVNMALAGVAPAELGAASGLFNLMRNLGGAIGIATVNTWLQDYTRSTAAYFGDALGHVRQGAMAATESLAASFSARTPDPVAAMDMARATFSQVVGKQAVTLAFGNVFFVMCCMFLAALVLVPFCKQAGAPASDTTAAH